MTRAEHYERSQRTAPAECFGGGYGRGPILPLEQPSWWQRVLGRRGNV